VFAIHKETHVDTTVSRICFHAALKILRDRVGPDRWSRIGAPWKGWIIGAFLCDELVCIEHMLLGHRKDADGPKVESVVRLECGLIE